MQRRRTSAAGDHPKSHPTRRDIRARLTRRDRDRNVSAGILAFACALSLSHGAFANPLNGQVAAGSAQIVQTSTNRLDINQSTDKAIINWGSFSIGQQEHTNFNQPSASSFTLNRVVGDDLSTIAGTLTANGNIILINPNGVFFTPTARVDVNSLIATTAGIADDDFLAGRYNFALAADPSSAVVNQGQITVAEGGLAALVAPWVENAGTINARLGKVALASGEAFTLDLYGDRLIQIAVPQGDGPGPAPAYATGNALVANSGTISANGGIVTLSVSQAKTMVDSVINMDGVIEARAVEQRGGTIVLHGGDSGVVRVAGRLDASGADAGQTGGTVKVLGEMVGLFDGAAIDVSGDAGGGTALIGGNYQGAGPESNALRTYVSANATINADAGNNGDGGKVIVWADEITRYYGSITARGGATSGDGGFVETSGKQNLAFAGNVDVGAANGADGTVLLDPLDIIIGGFDGVGPDDTEVSSDSLVAFVDGADSIFSIDAMALEALTGNIILEATRDIHVNAALNLTNQTAGESFILQAGNEININAAITTAGGGIHLEADSPHSTVGAGDGIGQLNINAPLISGGGGITLIGSGVFIGASGDVNAGTGDIAFTLASGGPISIVGQAAIDDLGTTGALIIGEAFTAGRPAAVGQTTEASVRLLASAINMSGAIDTTAAPFGTVGLYAAGDIVLSDSLDLAQDLFIRADADNDGAGAIVSGGGGGTVNVGTNNLLLIAGSGIGTASAPIQLVGDPTVAAETGAGGIYLEAAGSEVLTLSVVMMLDEFATATMAPGDIEITSLSGNIDVDYDGIDAGGNVILTAANSINVLYPVLGAGDVTLDAGNAVTVDDDVISTSGNVIIDGGNVATINGLVESTTGNVSIVSGGNISLGNFAIEAGGNVVVQASGFLSLPNGGDGVAEITANGDVTLAALQIGDVETWLEISGDGSGDNTLGITLGAYSKPLGSVVRLLTDQFSQIDVALWEAYDSLDIMAPDGSILVDINGIVGEPHENHIASVVADGLGFGFSYQLLDTGGVAVVDTGTIVAGGDVSLSAAGNLTIGSGPGTAIDATGGAYNVTLTAGNNLFGNGNILGGGTVDLIAGWGISFVGKITSVGNFTATANGGNAEFLGIATTGGGAVTISSVGDIVLQNVASTGSQTYTNIVTEGSGDTILNGASYTTAGGDFTINGSAIIGHGGSPTVNVSGGGNTGQIAFNGTLDGGPAPDTGGVPEVLEDLTLIIGQNGHITFGDNLFGLGTLTLIRLGATLDLVAADVSGVAGTDIALAISSADADIFNISGIPDGTTLTAGIVNGDGSYTVTDAQIGGLAVTPPLDSDPSFVLTAAAFDDGMGYVTLPAEWTLLGLANTVVNELGASAEASFTVSVSSILVVPPNIVLPPPSLGLPSFAVQFGRPARFRDVTPSTRRMSGTSQLADTSGEEGESESGFSEACPDVALASMSWQNTPADASFNVDPNQLPYSVNVYCGGYKLSDAGRGSYGEYETLTFVTRDFWTDFKQSTQTKPIDELLAILGLKPPKK